MNTISSLDRRMLERSREMDYITIEGLCLQTGCDSSQFDEFIVKELMDNALDATSGVTSTIGVTLNTQEYFMIAVADNGSGLLEKDVRRITDFRRSHSSKYHYKLPNRGALGNALSCVLGIPYALASANHQSITTTPIEVSSQGKQYGIEISANELENRIDCSISVGKPTKESGTRFSVYLPIHREEWGLKLKYIDLVRGYALFNPEAEFEVAVYHPKLEPHFSTTYKPIAGKHRRFTGNPSIHWYSSSEFKQLVEARIRSIIALKEEDIAIRQFIKEFRGLSSDEKIAQIMKEMQCVNIKNLFELANQPKLISKLISLMKKHSNEPRLDVLGEIGKKNLRRKMEQILGSISEFKYQKIKNVYRQKSQVIPYVLEVALAVLPNEAKLTIYSGINHSAWLKNPFHGYLVKWEDKNGSDHEAELTNDLLRKYEIDVDQPVGIVIHLICPNIDYQSYGKGKMNIEPFSEDIAQALVDVCRFYPRFKRGGKYTKGRTSKARIALREELNRRVQLFDENGIFPFTENSTQQGLFYKLRRQMEGNIGVRRESFITAIKEECNRIGKSREELGIFAAVRAEMYFRGKVFPISFRNVEDLAKKGCDIVLVEKEGICGVLAPYASRRGIALVNSRGFVVEYAEKLLYLSKEKKANIFFLTDYDASGFLISQKLQGISRIGVDLNMVSALDVKREEVEETYDTVDGQAPKKHLKGLPLHLQELVKEKRIEIDSVLEVVGPQRFWEYLEKIMLRSAPKRDLTRSVDLSINAPVNIGSPIGKIVDLVRALGVEKQREIHKKLSNWDSGFVDVDELEKNKQVEIMEVIAANPEIKNLGKELHEIAERYATKISLT